MILLAASSARANVRTGGDGCIEAPAFAAFQHDGLKVFLAPDLAYVHDGAVHVIDWKTGREDDTDPMQVLLQMRWALETYAELEGLEIRGHLEYVNAGVAQAVEASPGFREQAAETVREGVARMRAPLPDPERNIPLEMAAFERRETIRRNLLRYCERNTPAAVRLVEYFQ